MGMVATSSHPRGNRTFASNPRTATTIQKTLRCFGLSWGRVWSMQISDGEASAGCCEGRFASALPSHPSAGVEWDHEAFSATDRGSGSSTLVRGRQYPGEWRGEYRVSLW